MKNILWIMRILAGIALMVGATMFLIADIFLIVDIVRGADGDLLWAFVLLFVVCAGAWFFGLQLVRGKIVWKKAPEEEVYVQEEQVTAGATMQNNPMPDDSAQSGGATSDGWVQQNLNLEQPADATNETKRTNIPQDGARSTSGAQPNATVPTQPKPQTSGAIPIIRAWKYECRDAVYREYRMRRLIAPVLIPIIFMAVFIFVAIVVVGQMGRSPVPFFILIACFMFLPYALIQVVRPDEHLGMHLYLLTGDYRLWLVDMKQDDVQSFLFHEHGLKPQYYRAINRRRWIQILLREWNYMKQLKYIEENGLLDQWLMTGQAVNLADPVSVHRLKERENRLTVTFRVLNEYTGRVRKVNTVFRRKNCSDFEGLLSTLRNGENKEGF